MGKFYEFKAIAPMKGALYLYGEIASEAVWGDEVTAAQFQKDLAALGKIDALDLHINSVGGDVWAGMAIYSILSRLDAKITTYVDGLAASIASIIAMAGEKIIMPKNATMMIHQSMANPAGNKVRLRAIADELERIDGQQVDIFARKTGKKPDEIAAMMETDYFMTGAEAYEQGFSDELEEPRRLVACAGFAEFIARYETPPATDIEPEEPEAASDGGFSLPADNGGESQPVADKTNATKTMTDEQRQTIARIKRKILEV